MVAESLKAQIPQIGVVIKLTENNDPNNLIGRPGKFDAGSYMQDTRLKCSATKIETSCGAMIERWPSNADAKARMDYIQGILKSMPALGTEYDYVRGNLLLRVGGDLKPSQAKAYETAFVG